MKPDPDYGQLRPTYGRPSGGYGQHRPNGAHLKPKPSNGFNRPNHGGFGGHRGPKPLGEGVRYEESCLTVDGYPGQCSPASKCFYQFDDHSDLANNLCPSNGPLPTVCCPVDSVREPKLPFGKWTSKLIPTISTPNLNLFSTNQSAKAGPIQDESSPDRHRVD